MLVVLGLHGECVCESVHVSSLVVRVDFHVRVCAHARTDVSATPLLMKLVNHVMHARRLNGFYNTVSLQHYDHTLQVEPMQTVEAVL